MKNASKILANVWGKSTANARSQFKGTSNKKLMSHIRIKLLNDIHFILNQKPRKGPRTADVT